MRSFLQLPLQDLVALDENEAARNKQKTVQP